MDEREKVMDRKTVCSALLWVKTYAGLEADDFRNTFCRDKWGIVQQAMGEAIKLLEEEPRLLTKQDFGNNPDLDSAGALPAWVEYRRDEEWGDYWDDTEDEWALVYRHNVESETYRCWNKKPTREQMEAIPW